jgi:hypothetical protein
VPSLKGLGVFYQAYPALKRWAIFFRAYGARVGLAWCPQVRVHRLDAKPSAGSGQALGLGLTRAEEHAGLATRHFELAISSRPLRLNLHHTHLAEGVVPKTAPLPIARSTRK